MTVRDLIKLLLDEPLDMEITIKNGDHHGEFAYSRRVEDVSQEECEAFHTSNRVVVIK